MSDLPTCGTCDDTGHVCLSVRRGPEGAHISTWWATKLCPAWVGEAPHQHTLVPCRVCSDPDTEKCPYCDDEQIVEFRDPDVGEMPCPACCPDEAIRYAQRVTFSLVCCNSDRSESDMTTTDLEAALAKQAAGHREMRGAWQGLLGEDDSVAYVRRGRDRHADQGADDE